MGEFKAGDVVRLKSGGPPMTVTHIEDLLGTMTAWCEWHDGKKKQSDTFAVVGLEPVATTVPVVGVAVNRPNLLEGNRMFPDNRR